MKVLATIPDQGGPKVFEGTLLALKPGVKLSFFHCDYRDLTKKAVEETHITNGIIPVIVHDMENNFAAFEFTVTDGRWSEASLIGYTNDEGHWASGLIASPESGSKRVESLG